MSKYPGAKQLELIPRSRNPLVVVDRNHRLVRLCESLDWLELEATAQEIREGKLKNRAGRRPNLRVNLGAVVFMSVNRVTYREAEDQIRHYAPARYLCGLADSFKTPDFTTINDFMHLMGAEGLARLNEMVVRMAVEAGLGDPGVLVADTTAQEATMSYPTEVGLLGSFFRSVQKLGGRTGGKVKAALRDLRSVVNRGTKSIRTHRFFAKGKEERLKHTTTAMGAAKLVVKGLTEACRNTSAKRLQGGAKAARKKLEDLLGTMGSLLPQIDYWLENGYVAKNKIVNLFMPLVRSIPRGKVGKDVEFGIKWGTQRIGGGFILGTADAARGNFSDKLHVQEAVEHHVMTLGAIPTSFGYDRGGWSESNNAFLKEAGIHHNGMAPLGQAKWKVEGKHKEKLVKERARIEGDIGSIKSHRYGFNRPAARSEEMMIACGHRAMLGYNLNKLLRRQADEAGVALIG